ncbi:MAG: hypothetical protein KDK66_04525 [Deltaproteobacteria bacterium]|nr:hypothetical protein [Deltaproteobacteria bacterium]
MFYFIFYSLSLLCLTLLPKLSWACSTCYSAKEESLWAYYGTTLALTLLPFVLLGGLVYYLYRFQKNKFSS